MTKTVNQHFRKTIHREKQSGSFVSLYIVTFNTNLIFFLSNNRQLTILTNENLHLTILL